MNLEIITNVNGNKAKKMEEDNWFTETETYSLEFGFHIKIKKKVNLKIKMEMS